MNDNSTLGMVTVRSGELLTLVLEDDNTPGRPKRVSVITLADIDVSKEMAEYCEHLDRSTNAINTLNAMSGFLGYLVSKGMVKVPQETSVRFGNLKRPSSRLLNEYRYTINPEQFWEDKLLARYHKSSFNVISHQSHMLTIMAGIDSPFIMTATIIDGGGGILGMIRLDILSDNKHTLLNDDDIERLRLGLQADITMNVPDLMLMVKSVEIQSNPLFGVNRYKALIDLPVVNEDAPETLTI